MPRRGRILADEPTVNNPGPVWVPDYDDDQAFSMPVAVRSGSRKWHAELLAISIEGATLRSEVLLPVDAAIALELMVPRGTVELYGQVVWVRQDPDDPAMGLHFDDLHTHVRQVLEEFVARLMKRRRQRPERGDGEPDHRLV